MPIYKSSTDFLRNSVLSIKQQSYPVRLICILNGMNTTNNIFYSELLHSLGADLILSCPLKGISHALNFGIPHVRSEYVARQDDDDISHPERIRIQLSYLLEKNIDIVGSDIVALDSSGCPIQYVRYPDTDFHCKSTLVYKSCFCHGSVLLRSRLLKHYQYPHAGSEDYALWLRLCQKYRYGNVSIPLYYYRRHSDQYTHTRIPYLFLITSLGLLRTRPLHTQPRLFFMLLSYLFFHVSKNRIIALNA